MAIRVLVSVDLDLVDPTCDAGIAIDNAMLLMRDKFGRDVHIHGRCHRGGGHRQMIWRNTRYNKFGAIVDAGTLLGNAVVDLEVC